MHFFEAKLVSIAVMTYTYVYHLRNQRPMIRLICYAPNYFSKVAWSEAAKPVQKENLTRNRSFKVMHFGISEKLMTDCMRNAV